MASDSRRRKAIGLCGKANDGDHEITADEGYHSNQTMADLDAVGVRSYVSEPACGRRDSSRTRFL